ncbi:MAG TPA: thermonuclease family protein, partial [Nitrospiraceae bacterium]|nr:thermonuclease family protein [Nitrospiraceae bacterium]
GVHTGGRAGGAARKEVTVQTHGMDKYTRTIGEVILSDGTHVNHTLVKDGWCWWYRKYVPAIRCLENEAREVRKVLWADPQPVPPGSGGRRAIRTSGKSLCYATAPVNRIGVHRLRLVPCAFN